MSLRGFAQVAMCEHGVVGRRPVRLLSGVDAAGRCSCFSSSHLTGTQDDGHGSVFLRF